MAGEIIQGGDIAPGQGTLDKADEASAEADRRFLEADHDSVLAGMISSIEEEERKAIERGDNEPPYMSVTLTVNGLLVTGKMVGHYTWSQSFLNDTEEEPNTYEPPTEPIEWWERRHIHLIDAQVLTGSQFVPTRGGVAWRGRLSHVSGFIFGSVNPSTGNAGDE